MNTPRYRLERLKETIRNTASSDQRMTQMNVSIDCAVEIAESLVGLTVAVNSMANQTATVMNNLIAAVDNAREEAKNATTASGRAATESANLAKKLNSLTGWIMAATLLAAAAAVTQAGVAVYTLRHPQQTTPAVSAPAPVGPTSGGAPTRQPPEAAPRRP
jgi:hypothetical protein